jgi:hypothetical protein
MTMGNTKQRPPLTPADSTYLGLGHGDVHALRWASRSREGVRHTTFGTLAGATGCTCEWREYHPTEPCKHMRPFVDALRHHLGEPPPADPGGAALDLAQDALDDETRAWTEPPELAGPTASEEAARENLRYHLRKRLDRAVADDGHRWIQSRTEAGVRLTCAACRTVRGWASEGLATAWLEGGGACGCGGPTPPAPAAARKPLSEHLSALYGDS